VDAIRPRVWTREDVEPWYAQNTLLFAAPSALAESPALRREADRNDRPLNVMHPQIFETYRENWLPPAGRLLRQLPQALLYSLGLAEARDRLARRVRRILRR
jgi:hypothetical protein